MPAPKNAVLDSPALFRWYQPALAPRWLISFFDISTDGLQAHRATDDRCRLLRHSRSERQRRAAVPGYQSAGSALRFRR